MEKGWGIDLIRDFFATIDSAIYGLMATIYQIILDLADATIISSASIEEIYSRIYALLGIFMLFKVTFSFINYVINPDAFTDKTKGVQNLIKNVIIVLVMIIITPFAFDKLYEAQDAILKEDKLIPRFIIGSGDTDNLLGNSFKMSDMCPSSATAESDGDYLALVTLRPFYQIHPDHSIADLDAGFQKRYCTNSNEISPNKYLVSTIYKASAADNTYLVEYRYFLSTIVGIVVCLILVSFCFDIAVRSIKLAFLEILAPIPIISYIDPNSSKNGMFMKWLKQVGSTWASLFIRFIALFFAILIIGELDSTLSASGEYSFWVMLFLLIGALIFAKQLPKLLEELIPGLKLGGLQLNPFKKVANDAIGGKQLLGLGAGALGFGLGSLSNAGAYIKARREDAKDFNDAKAEALNSDSFNRFKEHLDRMKEIDKKGMTDKTYNNLFRKKLESETAKIYDPKHQKRMEQFSYSAPLRSNISQAFSGAKIAFNQGKNLKFDPLEIGKQSAQVRDYKDKYSVQDRVTDKATDFFGIKNDSGTTSQVKKDIKEQNDLLTRINRNIEMQNRAFSDLQSKMSPYEFSQAVTMDNATGNYVLNDAYQGAFRKDLEAVMGSLSALEQERLKVAKKINTLEKTRDQKPPKPGK